MMLNKELYELTNPQKNIFMREKFYSGTSINNLSFTFYIKKDLDTSICEKVLNTILSSNDALRTKIIIQNNNVFQFIEDFSYEQIPIKLFKSSINDLKIEMQNDAQIPFIFENSKLYKFVIYKLLNNETAIYIKLHHIIADAWVTKIFFKEFNFYYHFYETNPNKEIQIKNPSYIDFIDTEKKYFKSSYFNKDKAFWENYVINIPEAIPFKEIANKKTSRSLRYTKNIDISNNINLFCNKSSISPYTFFIAVYSMYLYKVQSKYDFTIGTPLLNRKNKKEKETLGMFVSTVPLKIHIDPNQSITEFIKRISVDLIGFLRHAQYPYDKILDFAHSQNNNNSNLFDTILSYQNIRPDMDFVDYEFSHFWNFSASQQTSLEMHITDYNGEGSYFLNLDYNENFCENIEINFVFDRLVNIMKQIIDKPTILLKDIYLLDKKEEEKVIKSFNDSDKFTPKNTLIELFDKQVELHPNKIALKFKDTELTYLELDKKVNAFANTLLEHNISGNIPVSILVERSLDMVISMLATLRVGAYYITIDPFWPNDRINYIIENSCSKKLITHKKYAEFHSNVDCIFIEDIDYSKKYKKIQSSNIKMSDFAYVIYTSGSTGKPKGTMMTNINIGNLLNSTYNNFKQNSNDIWTLFHTYTFDFSAWEIYGCLTTGGKLIIVPKEITVDPLEFFNLIVKENITILNQTPAYFYKLIDAEKLSNKKPQSLKLIILGGEAVFAEPLKYWKNKYNDIVIYNGYGPTETTIFAVMGEISLEDIKNNNIFIGYPLKNYTITIVNKDLQPLGIGCEGEICITSKSVCSGYFNNEALTKEKFIKTSSETLYKTGDVGFWNSDGRIKYIGRNDNQVKIRGFRVELEEIEKELLSCKNVSRAIVFPIENNNYTKTLIGFIETKKENYTSTVLNIIKKNLTSYMIPKLYQVSEMPINDNGKIDRKKLLESISNTKKEIILPNTKLEKTIYDLICKMKNISNLSIKDDFFQDIGLDSLDIMQLASSLAEYHVEIQKINNNSSIEQLADSIEKNKNDVNYISELYDINVENKKFSFNLSNVFLTGSMGYLGIHILKDLILNDNVEHIYCLIRPKNNINPNDRLNYSLKQYFPDYSISWLDKVSVITGDFEKPSLSLNLDEYQKLNNVITTIIHCGANVKHFGDYNSFYKTNVIGTENIIKFAYDSNASLAHISTLSIGGFSKINDKKLLTENKINIDQCFNNHVYMITKYEAECKILDALKKGLISAKIFRLGNIMPRFSDGLFQKNKLDNAFLSRLKTILDTNSIPKNYSDLKIDLSPVDLCSTAIVKLLTASNSQTIYHIFNNNTVKIKKIINSFNIEEVSVLEEIERIKKLNNPYKAHLLNDLINPSFFETPASNKLTMNKLNKLHFKWNKIDSNYIDKLYDIIKKF